MSDTINGLRNKLKPDVDPVLKPPGRFTSKPDFANTFMNFQRDQKAPGFISERERLSRFPMRNQGKSVFATTVTNNLSNLNQKVAF